LRKRKITISSNKVNYNYRL